MTRCVKIADKIIGDGHPCFVIAEIGINHNGSVELAKKMIDIAVTTGCDAVKFQKRTVEKVYSQGTVNVMEIWVDKETGVNYVFYKSGYAGGMTPLLDRDGKPVVSPILN